MIFYHVRLHVIACHCHLWLKEGQGEGTALRINPQARIVICITHESWVQYMSIHVHACYPLVN